MKRLGDTLTILLLAAAFGMAYYTGFVGKTAAGGPMLSANIFAIISMLGMLVLFVIGPVSALISRAKNKLITTGFVAFFCVQVLAFIGVCTMMVMLLTKMFDTDTTAIRVLYIIFTLIGIAGFVDALLFSDCLAVRDAALAGEAEAEEEETSEEADEATEEVEEEDAKSEEEDDLPELFLGF